jgi:hypothetical protein
VKNTKAKIIIIALMLLTFLGQAVASVSMSCSHEMTMDMATMDHDNMSDSKSHKTMMLESDKQNSNQDYLMDCCQEQCQCPMSGCVSLSFLLDTRFNAGVIAEQKISQLSVVHKSQINASLYRPPIL